MSTQEQNIEKYLLDALRLQIEDSVKSVIEEAKVELEKRVGAELDKMALSLLKNYSIERNSTQIIITVNKK